MSLVVLYEGDDVAVATAAVVAGTSVPARGMAVRRNSRSSAKSAALTTSERSCAVAARESAATDGARILKTRRPSSPGKEC